MSDPIKKSKKPLYLTKTEAPKKVKLAKTIIIDLAIPDDDEQETEVVEEDDEQEVFDYELDEEGYAIMIDIDEFEDTEESDSGLIPIPGPFTIPVAHIKMVDSGKLTKKAVFDMEYADLLRLATYKPAAAIIKKLIGVRGVYLLNEHVHKGKLVKTNIFPHQVETLTWMRAQELSNPKDTHGVKGGIIRLKQGLGKTLTALVHILSNEKGKFPTLIICSKTVMINWKTKGFHKFFGNRENSPKVLYFHSVHMPAKEMARMTRAQLLTYDIVVTSYDVCQQVCKREVYDSECFEMGDDHSLMKGKILSVHTRKLSQADRPDRIGTNIIYGTPWERVICDESQKFANPATKIYKAIMAIYGKYKWCLTGTPIRNYETDIWAQLRFCGYTGVEQSNIWKKKGHLVFKEHNLQSAILSMDYDDAGVELPPKHKYLINVELTGKQKEAYEFFLGVARDTYDKMMQNLCSFSCVLAMFTRLRQCAIAPYLTTAESKREKSKGAKAKGDKQALDILKKMNAGTLGQWCHDKYGEAGIYSAKMTEFVDTISRVPEDEKVLIFSSYTSCLDLLADALEERLPEFKFVQIDGDTKGEERETLLEQFMSDPEIRGAFFTYKVGGEGLDMIEATHCVLIEPWWTPAVEEQAESRCHRMGQTRPVHIHNIIATDTIEERVIAICNEKRAMASSYLEGTTRVMEKAKLDKYTLGRMLGLR